MTEIALTTAIRVANEFSWSSLNAHVLGLIGENATVLLPEEQWVLRICASIHHHRAHRELRLADWLRSYNIPAVRAIDGMNKPLIRNGWTITVWEHIPGVRPASTDVIGAALRQLHELTEPSEMGLPTLDPFDGITDYVNQAHLRPHEVDFLRLQLDNLRNAYIQLDLALPPGPVHGDAHRKNIVQDESGHPVILDLERFSTGAREWDLVVAAMYERLGWYTSAEYKAFISSYGWDIRKWSGFETMAAVRELRMTAWLCARKKREPRLLPEARRRIASLRDPPGPRVWQPGT